MVLQRPPKLLRRATGLLYSNMKWWAAEFPLVTGHPFDHVKRKSRPEAADLVSVLRKSPL